MFYIKMLIFMELCKTQSDQNIHQNAPYIQNFLGGPSISMVTNQNRLTPDFKFFFI